MLPERLRHKESALSLSFSDQLGLQLELKTGRDYNWNSFEGTSIEIQFFMADGSLLLSVHPTCIAVWNTHEGRLVNKIELEGVMFAAKKNEDEFFALCEGKIHRLSVNGSIQSSIRTDVGVIQEKILWSETAQLLIYSTDKKVEVYDQFFTLRETILASEIMVGTYVGDVYFNESGVLLTIGVLEVNMDMRRMHINVYSTMDFSLKQEHVVDDCFKLCAVYYPYSLLAVSKDALFSYSLKSGSRKEISNSYVRLHERVLVSGDELVINNEGVGKLELWDMKEQQKKAEIEGEFRQEYLGFDAGRLVVLNRDNDSYTLDVYAESLGESSRIEILRNKRMLQWYDPEGPAFCFYDLYFDFSAGTFKSVNDSRVKLELEDLPGRRSRNGKYMCCLFHDELARHKVLFSEIHGDGREEFSPEDFGFGSREIKYLSFIPELNCFTISGPHFAALYDPDDSEKTVGFVNDELEIANLQVSDNGRYALFAAKGAYHLVDIAKGNEVARRDVPIEYKERWVTDKTGQFAKAYFLPGSERLICINAVREEGHSHVMLFESDLDFKVKRSVKMDIEIEADDYDAQFNSFEKTRMNHSASQMLFTYNHRSYLIEMSDFSFRELGTAEELRSCYQRKAVFSDKDRHVVLEDEEYYYLFDVAMERPAKTFRKNEKGRKQHYIFDDERDLLIVATSNETLFYRVSSNEFLGRMFVDSRGKFIVKMSVDSSSKTGLFWTNVPEALNVIKTKIDGSDPEVLGLDDMGRSIFVRQHNKKELVTKRLFDPLAYEEYLRNHLKKERRALSDLDREIKGLGDGS